VSVMISAFNALPLSPALSALLLRPKREARGPLGVFFRWFNRVFARATDGYVRTCGHLIHKMAFSLLLLLGFAVLTALMSSRLPHRFLPTHHPPHFYLHV